MDLNALARSTGLEEAERALEGSEWTLEFVSSVVDRFSSELAEIQLELSKQVHGQVEDAKFAAVVIGNAEQDLKHVIGNFSQLSSRVHFLQQRSSPFEQLKRASTAKRNLTQVTEQIELYRKVPIRVKRLLVELEQDARGANLRRIFREWLGICVWRDRVIGHVEGKVQSALASEARSRRRALGEVLAEDTAELAMSDSLLPASSQQLETQLALLKNHFRDSFVLGDRLTEICQDFATRLTDTASKRPQDLVVVAEICALGDRQVARERQHQGKTGGGASGGGAGAGRRKAHFLQAVGEFVDARAANKLASLGPMSLFVSRADELLGELVVVRDSAQPCFPQASMPVLQVCRKWTEAHLLRECTARAKSLAAAAQESGEDDVAAAEQDRLLLGAWLGKYVREMPQSAGLERFLDSLVDEHMALCAMTRIDSTSAVSKQDFFQMLQSELAVCLPHFTGPRLLRVFQCLVEVCVHQYLEHRKQILNTELPHDLCEFVEDCTDCEDELRLLFDACTEQFLASALEEGNLAMVIGGAADLVEAACRTLQQAAHDFGIWPLVTQHVFAFGTKCTVLIINTWFFSDRLRLKPDSAAFARTLKFAFEWLVKQYVQNVLLSTAGEGAAVPQPEQIEQDWTSMLHYFESKRDKMWMSKEELERSLALLGVCANALRGEESYGSFLDHFSVRDAKLVIRRLRQLATAASSSTADLDQEFAPYATNQLATSRVELDFASVQRAVDQAASS